MNYHKKRAISHAYSALFAASALIAFGVAIAGVFAGHGETALLDLPMWVQVGIGQFGLFVVIGMVVLLLSFVTSSLKRAVSEWRKSNE